MADHVTTANDIHQIQSCDCTLSTVKCAISCYCTLFSNTRDSSSFKSCSHLKSADCLYIKGPNELLGGRLGHKSQKQISFPKSTALHTVQVYIQPRFQAAKRKAAWYTLYAHVRTLPQIFVDTVSKINSILFCTVEPRLSGPRLSGTSIIRLGSFLIT